MVFLKKLKDGDFFHYCFWSQLLSQTHILQKELRNWQTIGETEVFFDDSYWILQMLLSKTSLKLFPALKTFFVDISIQYWFSEQMKKKSYPIYYNAY